MPLVSFFIPDASFQLEFFLCKAEQPLQDMKLQEKEKDEKHIWKLFQKNLKLKVLLPLDLKPPRS